MKHKNINPQILVLLLVIASILAAIVIFSTYPKPSIKNSLLDNSICSMPCWQGVKPGATTSSEALRILQNSNLIRKSSINSNNSSDAFGGASWMWQTEGAGSEARLWWRNGIVREIILPMDDISVDEIVGRYGPPEKVSVISVGIPEEWEWGVTFYYPRHGFQIQINDLPGFDAELNPSDYISFITLFEPSTLEERILFEGHHIEYLNLQEWKGYGSIVNLYYNQ